MRDVLRGRTRPALEIIDFQSDNFGAKLEKRILEIKDCVADNVPFDDIVKEIEGMVRDRIGFKVFITTSEHLAAILPFYSNRNHVLLNKWWRGEISIPEQNKILRDAESKKGWVNIEKATVGGLFTEMTYNLFLNFKTMFIVYKLTVAEIVAVMLHELGHAFYACEYSDRLESTNQILAKVSREVNSKKEKKDLTYIYHELKKINKDIDEGDAETIAAGGTIPGKAMFKVIIGVVRTQMGSDAYDQTAFEQLSDNFSARFGYSRHLVTGLDKLHVAGWSPEKSSASLFFISMIQAIWLVTLTAASTVALFSGVFFQFLCGAYILLIMYGLLKLSGTAFKDMTYDGLKDRYLRVRREVVALLKDSKIPNEQIKGLLEDLYAIDLIVKETNEGQTLFNILGDVLFSDNRAGASSMKEQQLLEGLASNDIFVKAAHLRTM